VPERHSIISEYHTPPSSPRSSMRLTGCAKNPGAKRTHIHNVNICMPVDKFGARKLSAKSLQDTQTTCSTLQPENATKNGRGGQRRAKSVEKAVSSSCLIKIDEDEENSRTHQELENEAPLRLKKNSSLAQLMSRLKMVMPGAKQGNGSTKPPSAIDKATSTSADSAYNKAQCKLCTETPI